MVESLNMGYVCHVVPSIWVHFCIIRVPQNGSVSESLMHTSRHKCVNPAAEVVHSDLHYCGVLRPQRGRHVEPLLPALSETITLLSVTVPNSTERILPSGSEQHEVLLFGSI